uniref:Uncharacterized protein n=1 Tax=Setaria digitata TaxID=48799 RepID=A0A915Q5V0_9BILA
MKASQVFCLTRTTTQQLTDLDHFSLISVSTLLDTGTRIVIKMLPPPLNFTSRKAGNDSRVPNGSLLSLRTFYAFGARSGRTPSLQRSISYNAYESIQLREATITTIRRSSTASLMHNLKHNITYYNRCHFTPISNISKPYSYSSSIVKIHAFSKWERKQQNQQMRIGKFSLPKVLRHTLISTMQNPLSTRSHDAENDVELKHGEQPVNEAAIPEVKEDTPKVQEDSAEMITLREKNMSLEAEVERLTLKLREKERTERELRRKILENAAEIKVWKKKYEMAIETTNIEVSESKDNEEEISDIMEQLNSAAEKLTRLDAVKDLKLLQMYLFDMVFHAGWNEAQ